MVTEDALFRFLRLGVELDNPDSSDLSLLKCINKKEWEEIKEISINQGVSAIIIDGINRVIELEGSKTFSSSIQYDWWQPFILEWSYISIITETRNKRQEQVMNELGSIWTHKGCRVLIMKGLANGLYYPKPEHRNTGDIDCYLFGDYDKGNQIARDLGARINEDWYKHSEIIYKGEIFENHRFLIPIRDSKESKRMDEELRYSLLDKKLEHFPNSDCYIPHPQFCAMFLTAHASGHFLFEGLRLKQVLDWAMFLQIENTRIDWTQFYAFCNRYNLRRFVDALNAICIDRIGIKINNHSIVKNSPYSEKILNNMLYDNDYVYSKDISNWGKRYLLIRNMFKYKWKFEGVYGQSVWLRLFNEIKGFMLHTV